MRFRLLIKVRIRVRTVNIGFLQRFDKAFCEGFRGLESNLTYLGSLKIGMYRGLNNANRVPSREGRLIRIVLRGAF